MVLNELFNNIEFVQLENEWQKLMKIKQKVK